MQELDLPEFGKGLCRLLATITKDVYSTTRSAHWNLSCIALAFTCEIRISESERSLVISDLVFCDKAEKYRFVEMLFYTLVYLCIHWGERHLNLVISDPVPPVYEALRYIQCPWDSTCADFELSADRMRDVIVPCEIRATGCCLSRVEYTGRSENWEIKLPSLNASQILDCSRGISEEFIYSLECLLYRLHLVFKTKPRRKVHLRTDAVCVSVDFLNCKQGILLELITVRPCLQGKGIATMILWILMSRCVRFNVAKLTLTSAYPSSAALVAKLGGFEETNHMFQHSDYTIKLDDMRGKTLQACGLEGRLKEHEEHPGYFVIDPSHFPIAEELNSQQAVEDRYKKRRVEGLGEGVAAGV